MKTLLTLGFLLTAIILFPGCYTIVFIEPTDEVVSYNPGPLPPPDPGPWPCADCTAPPPPYFPPPVYVDNNPPSAPPSSDSHREIRTGRGPFDPNPTPIRTDENNRPERAPGGRR